MRRAAQAVALLYAMYISVAAALGFIKQKTVHKMFWGRGVAYKNIFHVAMFSLTVMIVLTGVVRRVSSVNANDNFTQNNKVVGLSDLLQQGGSIETVLAVDPSLSGVRVKKHFVTNGESLETIANQYGVTIDTIRWANRTTVSPFSNKVEVGWELDIPELNGVFYEVKPGQSMQGIINDTGGNEFDIAEFNNLSQPYTLTAGQKLFIPDGNFYRPDIDVVGIPRGVFINPLSHPNCAGYQYQRGFLSYHDGVDLSKWNGCPVEAVAAGTVYYAGWEDLSGNTVKIDHGGGIHTYYYHAESVYVKVGQRVQQGDLIMYMGKSGNSTGVHLHFVLRKDGIAVNPSGYVPY